MRLFFLLLVALLMGSGGGQAVAAEAFPVLERPLRAADPQRQLMQARGWEGWGLRLDLDLSQALMLDSNLFAAAEGARQDWLTQTAMTAGVSTGPEHWTVGGQVRVEQVMAMQTPEYDHTGGEARVFIDGRAWDRSRLTGGVVYRRQHDLPGDPRLLGASVRPVPGDHLGIEGRTVVRSGRWLIGGSADLSHLNYHDTTIADGRALEQDDRDHWQSGASTRLGVALGEAVDLFAEHRQRVVVHDRRQPGGLEFGFTENQWLAGVAFDVPDRLAGELVAGIREVDWQSPSFTPLDQPMLRAGLTWQMTPLLAVGGQAWRDVEVTSGLGYAGILADGIAARLDYEVTRRLSVSMDAERVRRRWVGLGPRREDHLDQWGGGVHWQWTPRWSLGLSLRAERRESSAATLEYERMRTLLRIGARL